MEKKWITAEMNGYRRRMPEEKWPFAQETSRWMIEKAISGGMSKERAEKLYSVHIVDEDCENE